MLQQQVESLRAAIFRISLRQSPPSTVIVLAEQADFLGVKRDPKVKSLTPSERSAIQPLPRGKPYGKLVRVRLDLLYLALKEAKGVNHPDYQPR